MQRVTFAVRGLNDHRELSFWDSGRPQGAVGVGDELSGGEWQWHPPGVEDERCCVGLSDLDSQASLGDQVNLEGLIPFDRGPGDRFAWRQNKDPVALSALETKPSVWGGLYGAEECSREGVEIAGLRVVLDEEYDGAFRVPA